MSLKHFEMSVISSCHHDGFEELLCRSESLAYSTHLDMTQGSSFPLEKIIGVKKCERESVLRIPGTHSEVLH
jgi:hypothetical protein